MADIIIKFYQIQNFLTDTKRAPIGSWTHKEYKCNVFFSSQVKSRLTIDHLPFLMEFGAKSIFFKIEATAYISSPHKPIT